MLVANEAGLPPVDPGCGSRDVHIHDVFIENGDDSIVMKQGWPTAEQIPPAGCTRDVLVERVTIFRGMGANIGGMGDVRAVRFPICAVVLLTSGIRAAWITS